MKMFVYAMREYDELPYFKEICEKMDITFEYTTDYPSMDNYKLAEGFEAVNIITNPLPAELLDKFYSIGVKSIATRTIGYDHIDVAHAHELGIRVCNASYSPNAVANYTIMLMLMCCRNIIYIMQKSALQDFGLEGKIGRELSLCTVGVVGTGRIGETLIKHLSGFGCKILAYDVFVKEEVKKYADYVSIDELYAKSDIITLHVPGMQENYHMIDKTAFDKMKDGVIFINAARGMLVDSEALVQAVESGKLGFAALDTIEQEAGMYYHNLEGKIMNNRYRAILSSFPNVYITPHTAFYTDQAVSDMVFKSVGGLYNFSKGESTDLEV